MANMELVAEVLDLLIFEGSSIVRYNGHGDTVTTDKVVQDEFGYLFARDICKWNGFHPLCKVVCGNKDKGMAIG